MLLSGLQHGFFYWGIPFSFVFIFLHFLLARLGRRKYLSESRSFDNYLFTNFELPLKMIAIYQLVFIVILFLARIISLFPYLGMGFSSGLDKLKFVYSDVFIQINAIRGVSIDFTSPSMVYLIGFLIGLFIMAMLCVTGFDPATFQFNPRLSYGRYRMKKGSTSKEDGKPESTTTTDRFEIDLINDIIELDMILGNGLTAKQQEKILSRAKLFIQKEKKPHKLQRQIKKLKNHTIKETALQRLKEIKAHPLSRDCKKRLKSKDYRIRLDALEEVKDPKTLKKMALSDPYKYRKDPDNPYMYYPVRQEAIKKIFDRTLLLEFSKDKNYFINVAAENRLHFLEHGTPKYPAGPMLKEDYYDKRLDMDPHQSPFDFKRRG